MPSPAYNLLLLHFVKNYPLQKKIIEIFSVFLVCGLTIVFLTLALLDATLLQTLHDMHVQPNPTPGFQAAAYPLLTTKKIPYISAASAIIMDADSHVFVYQKNTDLRISPASTTKMMTAMIALSHFQPNDVLTVKSLIDTQGSGLGLTLGETVTFENLLKGALILSANDAAYTIAQNYPGGEKAFVSAMNEKAKELHLWNTHFGDPDGLDDNQDYTTAEDLVRLASIAMQNPLFASIVDTKTATIASVDGKDTYTFDNRNILLGYDGINGIKTGFTDEAGEVLATSTIVNNHTFYIIVMKSDDRFGDTQALLPMLHTITFLSMHP